MIKRDYYLNQLIKLKDQKVIKVITGIRRSGKSTLLALFRDELKNMGIKSAQIQSFNFEEESNVELRDWRALHQRIAQKLVPDAMNYISLDEIQKVEHFEEAVDSLFVKENVDLYITGSNAFLLSGELATYLTGRYISIHMLPFSFAEYREANSAEMDENKLFMDYLNSSSFPEAVNLSNVDAKLAHNYLKDLYDTIINKDIATRFEIRNQPEFLRVAKYLFANIGNPTSARTVANVLNGTNGNMAHNTVVRYMDYLSQSYLLYPVSRYDVKGKKLLTTNDKYYAVDLGLRQMLLYSSLESDLGHKLENIVYLELLKRNEGEIMVGKADESEVDFIVQKPGGERVYYQVAYHITSEEILQREIRPFVKIRDNYPKILLTLDMINEEYSGIQKVNLVKWLLGK